MAGTQAGARVFPTLDFISHSPEQTRRIGRRIGQHARAGDLLLLSGAFGAGKTMLTQGLATGLGITERVTSPSFALVNEYPGRDSTGQPIRFCHIDLYRLETFDAVASVGLDDYFAAPDGICAIEWPEHLLTGVPDEHLLVTISPVSETKRRLAFTPRGPRYAALLADIKTEAFGVEG